VTQIRTWVHEIPAKSWRHEEFRRRLVEYKKAVQEARKEPGHHYHAAEISFICGRMAFAAYL